MRREARCSPNHPPDLYIPLNTALIPAFIPVFTLNPITYRLLHTGLHTGMILLHTPPSLAQMAQKLWELLKLLEV